MHAWIVPDLQDWQGKGSCLARACLGQANHILVCKAARPWKKVNKLGQDGGQELICSRAH